MIGKTVLKTLDDLSHEVVEPEPDKSGPAHLESIPASLQEARHVPLPVWESEFSKSQVYRHWGINE
jgi:hypothetical protein